MTAQVFAEYVSRRLTSWGREFRLDREFVSLGHKSKDILQVLIEHKGEMPQRSVGFKPIEIPLLEMEVEDIVHDMHAIKPVFAIVMRAFYCGSGRVGFERREIAERLLGHPIPKRKYFEAHEGGFVYITAALRTLTQSK